MPKLMLIDDDPALIPKQVRQAFPAPSHQVEVAKTGAAGLARVRAEPPDVILLDLRLPDQSGLEVYKAIRLIDARIPVIFITSSPEMCEIRGPHVRVLGKPGSETLSAKPLRTCFSC